MKESKSGAPLTQPLAQQSSDPNVSELAMLAAALRRSGESDWSRLAAQAFELWQACRQQIRTNRDDPYDRFNELCAEVPKPDEYPVTLAAFLVLMLPKRRPSDRIKVYRNFLMDWKGLDFIKAGDLIAEQKKSPADTHSYLERAYVLQAWLEAHASSVKRVNGIKGQKALPAQVIKAAEDEASQKRKNVTARAAKHWNATYTALIRTWPL